jgi:hypothetical protein
MIENWTLWDWAFATVLVIAAGFVVGLVKEYFSQPLPLEKADL